MCVEVCLCVSRAHPKSRSKNSEMRLCATRAGLARAAWQKVCRPSTRRWRSATPIRMEGIFGGSGGRAGSFSLFIEDTSASNSR